MGNTEGTGQDALNAREVKTMDWELKHKLARGSTYNMKVVLRGDRNTGTNLFNLSLMLSGKTQLFRRLQGQPFTTSYTPTEQIQVATINWNYKVTDDVVKLEVWDVVDKGKTKKRTDKLKVSNNEPEEEEEEEEQDVTPTMVSARIPTPEPSSPIDGKHHQEPKPTGSFTVASIDARTVDVMRGANGVVFLFDMTKRWTWEYVTRELPKVPQNANFRDLGDHRVVSQLEIEELANSRDSNFAMTIECSMRNAFGMKTIASFFSLPFLHLQRQHILAQLERNEAESKGVVEEIKLISEAQSYDRYLQSMEAKKSSIKVTPPQEMASSPVASSSIARATQSPVMQAVPNPSTTPEPIKQSATAPVPVPGSNTTKASISSPKTPSQMSATPQKATSPPPVQQEPPKVAEKKKQPEKTSKKDEKPKSKPKPADPKKQKEDELKAVEELKKMAQVKPKASSDVDSFVAGDLDEDTLFSGKADDDGWGGQLGDPEDETPVQSPTKKKGKPVMVQEVSEPSDEEEEEKKPSPKKKNNPLVTEDLDPEDDL